MNTQQLENLKAWAKDYIEGFYGREESIDANLELKRVHTAKVVEAMEDLAAYLDLPEGRRNLAAAVGLLHDIGRFPQFAQYGTYNDLRSTNHCKLGLKVIEENGVLDPLNEQEADIIRKTVGLHGVKEIPSELGEPALTFCRMIRDADKLDIFRVVTEYHKKYLEDPAGFMVEMEFEDTPEYSAEIVDDLLHERLIDYRKLRTMNDMKLLQLSWVYDINYNQTLEKVRQRRHLEYIIGILPQTDDITAVVRHILAYVEQRLSSPQKGISENRH